MSFSLYAKFILFDKAVETNFAAKKIELQEGAIKHVIHSYAGKATWEDNVNPPEIADASTNAEVSIQWTRDQFEEEGKPNTNHSFTLVTKEYELKVTSIPGLNIELDQPIYFKFKRLSVGSKKGRFLPIGDSCHLGEEAPVTSFANYDFEVEARIPGKGTKIITRSDFIKPDTAISGQQHRLREEEGLSTTQDGVVWYKVDKKLVALHLTAIGFKWENGRICVLINAGISMSGLQFETMGLAVKVNPSTMFSALPTFDLDGLEFSLNTETFAVGASLLKGTTTDTHGNEVTQYIGAALMEFKKNNLTLYGLGAYASMNGHQSLFLYFGLNKAIGGPAFFNVQGLSVGIGYNRSLKVDFDEIENFPLIKLAFGDAELDKAGLLKLSTDLAPFVLPAMGESFLMAGVRFDTYKLIKSFALFVAKFTDKFTVELYGLSRLEIIRNEATYVFVEIKLKGDFDPEAGFVKLLGGITNNSYIIDKDIRLTGGFAFSTWWKGGNAGDFVLTIGGYHPTYKIPDHYPKVPRIALEWKVSDNFLVTGQTYFALTPSVIMAGLDIQARYTSDDLKANFAAGMHFLIQWAPFHYDVRLYAHLDIQYHLNVDLGWFGSINETVHLTAGADLHIYGPDFGVRGTAYLSIDLGIKVLKISVDIAIGPKLAAPPDLSWKAFKEQFLSENSQGGWQDGQESNPIQFQVIKGLIGTAPMDVELLLLHAKEIVLRIQTVVPITKADLNNSKSKNGQSFIIGTMGNKQITESLLKISIKNATTDELWNDFEFTSQVIEHNSPAALWGKKPENVNSVATVETLNVVELELNQGPTPGDPVSIKHPARLIQNPESGGKLEHYELVDFQYPQLVDFLEEDNLPPLNTGVYFRLQEEASHALV